MIGPRAGGLVGPRVFPVVGGVSGSSVLFADASAGKSCPGSAAEWTALGLATSNPTSLHSWQQASGNGADLIGTTTLTANGTPNYQQTIPGWTRKAVTLDAGTTDRFSATIANSNASDFLMLMYVAMTAPATGTRLILEHPTFFAEILTTGKFHANAGTPVAGVVDAGTSVHALVVKNWISNSRGLITEDEVITPAEFVAAGTAIVVGGSTSNTAPMAVLYSAMWEGVPARMSNAQIKTMLQTLGWSVAW
jgi:hypothetical protein